MASAEDQNVVKPSMMELSLGPSESTFVPPTALTTLSVPPGLFPADNNERPQADKDTFVDDDLVDDSELLDALKRIWHDPAFTCSSDEDAKSSGFGTSYESLFAHDLASFPQHQNSRGGTAHSGALINAEPRQMAPCGCPPEAMPCHFFWKKKQCSKGEDCKMCHHRQVTRKSRPCKHKRIKAQKEKAKEEKERAKEEERSQKFLEDIIAPPAFEEIPEVSDIISPPVFEDRQHVSPYYQSEVHHSTSDMLEQNAAWSYWYPQPLTWYSLSGVDSCHFPAEGAQLRPLYNI